MNIFPSQSILHSGVLLCLPGGEARNLMSLCEALDEVCVVSKVQGEWYCVRTTTSFLPDFLMQMASLGLCFFNRKVPELVWGELRFTAPVTVFAQLPDSLK